MKGSKKSSSTRFSDKLSRLLGLVLLIGLILIIPLFFTVPIRANNAPVVQTTPTAYTTLTPLPGEESLPTLPAPTSIIVRGKKPSTCRFPLPHTRAVESVPEDYIFSEPQEPLPPEDSLIEIVEWLPDNQRALLVESYDDVTTGEYKQDIKLLNPQTGETRIYASRQPGSGVRELPAWVPSLNAVIYPETRLLKAKHENGMILPPYEFERQLLVSRGDPANLQILENAHLSADNMSTFSVTVRPGGDQIVYRNQVDKQFSKKDNSLRSQPPVAFDPTEWDYRGSRGAFPTFEVSYLTAWRPGSSQIFLYTYGGPDMGYTLLLDANSGKVCELDLDGWALLGRWSPNGRYLAIIRVQEPSFPVSSTDLVVLDTATGQTYKTDVVSQEAVGNHSVNGIAWAPDNSHILVLGRTLSFPGCSPDCQDDTRLYLVDFQTGQVSSILPEKQFTANDPGTNLAWSPDGSKVLALCPNLCLISVQRNNK